jgi:N6-L-threonylcarbamoyladenine synthase
MKKTLRILSIETSCDETGLAVTQYNRDEKSYNVLVDSLNSQIDIHKEFGGVFPMIAKREHGNNLVPLLYVCLEKIDLGGEIDTKNINIGLLDREKELKEIIENELKKDSLLKKIPEIDYIAVTRGPGLEPALWVGVSFAKFLSTLWQKPLVSVNHMEGHISSVLLENKIVEFPTLSLLISGGHTELVDIKNWGQYKIIGKTRDDAVGEAYDKVARILGMEYPGGPLIANRANKLRENESKERIQLEKDKENIKLPRPMIRSQDLDLSFSGLKTAVLYLVRDLKKNKNIEILPEEIIDLICHEFEESVAEVLISKLNFAFVTNNKKYKNLIVAGGVIANEFLQENIEVWCKENGLHFLKPNKKLATDNGVMIGLAAIVGLNNGYLIPVSSEDEKFMEIKPDGDWSLDTI